VERRVSDQLPVKAVEGQVVGSEPGTIKVAGKTIIPAILTDNSLHLFSGREMRFLEAFTKHFDLELACQEIGLGVEAGRKYLRRKHIKTYLEDKLRQAALAQGTDINNHLAWLRDVRDGRKVVTKESMDAAKVLARLLKPASGVSLNLTQNNVNVGGASATPSPYAGMSFEQIAAAMRDRLSVLDGRRA
jgi:hypothetical protein